MARRFPEAFSVVTMPGFIAGSSNAFLRHSSGPGATTGDQVLV